MQGGGRQPHIIEVNKTNYVTMPQTVRIRKYEIDKEKLCQLLRESKSKKGIGVNQISEYLGIKKSKVEHWFRKDDYFDIPDENVWFNLKELLGIETDEFDEQITTFEERDGVFEKAERVYFENGLAPTILTESTNEKFLEIKKMKNQSMIIVGDSLAIIESEKVPKIKIRQATKDGFIECEVPGIVDLNYECSTTRRGRVIEGGRICPTLATENIPSVIEFGNEEFYNFLYLIDGDIYLIRIRKLTPRECWSLMDFNIGSFERAELVASNTRLYKCAGNSIVVNCLVAVIGQMIEGKENVYKQIDWRE